MLLDNEERFKTLKKEVDEDNDVQAAHIKKYLEAVKQTNTVMVNFLNMIVADAYTYRVVVDQQAHQGIRDIAISCGAPHKSGRPSLLDVLGTPEKLFQSF
jgi:hypothetical protein